MHFGCHMCDTMQFREYIDYWIHTTTLPFLQLRMEGVVKRSSLDMSSILFHVSSVAMSSILGSKSPSGPPLPAPLFATLFRFAEKVLGGALQEQTDFP